MSRLDIVIFGASGFTGKKAVEEIARVAKKYGGITWGIAGRSKEKLENVLATAANNTGEDLTGVKIIIAEVHDEPSLRAMCQQAKVLVNCCGPYRLYGEPVVKAALDERTHYVDVTGEPEFIESMQLLYDETAKSLGVYVVNACGLDSIPNDMGVVFMEQNFEGTLNTVESYLSINLPPGHFWESIKCGGIHYGTWESLVYSVANDEALGPLRRKLYKEKLPTPKPKLEARSVIHKKDDGYGVPFPGADNSIVYRTQRFFYEQDGKRPIQFKAYMKMQNLLYAFAYLLFGVMVYGLSKSEFTMNLLLKYPRLFSFGMVSHEGPSDNLMNRTHFKLEMYGQGWSKGDDVKGVEPNKKIVAEVSGVNPGYGATVTMLIMSAITVLRERSKMPGIGGVLTTGAAFYKTDLLKNLHENNVKFELKHV